MQPLRTDNKPFDQKVMSESATTWLIPKLVGEVKFTEWTNESEVRHPAFLGLRTTIKLRTSSANNREKKGSGQPEPYLSARCHIGRPLAGPCA
jgi:ATP-dependent DNA ligase